MEDIQILDNGESEVQITTIGKVIGSDSYGNPIEQNFSEESLKKIAENQKDDILVDVDHCSELNGNTEAKGWLSNLKFIEGKGLFGKIKWTDIGRKLIENRVFRWLSPSWLLNEDKTPEFMTSCALTNKPSQIGKIKPIINSIQDVIIKEPIIKKEFDDTFKNNLNKDILDMTREELKELIKEVISEINKEISEADENITQDVKDEIKEEITEEVIDNNITSDVKEEVVEDKKEDETITSDVKEDDNKVENSEDITPDVKEDDKEEIKEVKEIIKIESLNSSPSPILNQEPEWKNLKGEAFRNWVKKHPMGI